MREQHVAMFYKMTLQPSSTLTAFLLNSFVQTIQLTRAKLFNQIKVSRNPNCKKTF